jgi:putative membrane protein
MSQNSAVFFTDDEKKTIESVIADVEKKSSGEIVAMVVDRSDDYADIDVLGAVLGAAFISVYPSGLFFMLSERILHRLIPSISWTADVPVLPHFYFGLCSFVLFTIIFYFLLLWIIRRQPVVKRFFLHDRRKEREIRDRALRAFHEHRLDRTRDATGVLFLISLLERKVYVAADHGIYNKISQTALDGFAAAVAKGVAQGKACEALCESIRAIGVDLAQFFPARDDDKNELSDKVVTG